jgi:hypothetical protein
MILTLLVLEFQFLFFLIFKLIRIHFDKFPMSYGLADIGFDFYNLLRK